MGDSGGSESRTRTVKVLLPTIVFTTISAFCVLNTGRHLCGLDFLFAISFDLGRSCKVSTLTLRIII